MRQINRAVDRPERKAPPSTTRRLLWFVALWAAGVLATGAVAALLRLWIA